jgi:hypothetical protein
MPTNDDMTTPLTRADLKQVNDQLAEFAEQLADRPTHAQVTELLAKLRAEIADDMRTTNNVLLEDAFKRFRVIDDQYKDLPSRVAKLERVVFPPPRARRKRAG